MSPRKKAKLLSMIGLGLGALLAYGATRLSAPNPEDSAKKCQQNMAQIVTALETFKSANGGYPVALEFLPGELPSCPEAVSAYGYGYGGGSGSGPRHNRRAKSFQLTCSTKGHFEHPVASKNWKPPEVKQSNNWNDM